MVYTSLPLSIPEMRRSLHNNVMSVSSGQEHFSSQSTNHAHTNGQNTSKDTDTTSAVRAGTMGTAFVAANQIDVTGLKQTRRQTKSPSDSNLQQTHSINTEGTANSQSQYTDVDS